MRSSVSASKKKRKAEPEGTPVPHTPGIPSKSEFLSVGTIESKKMAASAEDVSKLGEGLEELNIEVQEELDDPNEFADAEEEHDEDDSLRVVFLTEQISHHPPASSYYFACPEKGVEAAGVDQISAKVSGTSTWFNSNVTHC